MQKNIPEKLLGRIFTIISISIISMAAFSSGIIGFLSDIVKNAQFLGIAEFPFVSIQNTGIQTIFLLFGVGAGLCGIVGFLHPKIKHLN